MSRSCAAVIPVDDPEGASLVYQYENQPLANAMRTMHMHYGTAMLRMSNGGCLAEIIMQGATGGPLAGFAAVDSWAARRRTRIRLYRGQNQRLSLRGAGSLIACREPNAIGMGIE